MGDTLEPTLPQPERLSGSKSAAALRIEDFVLHDAEMDVRATTSNPPAPMPPSRHDGGSLSVPPDWSSTDSGLDVLRNRAGEDGGWPNRRPPGSIGNRALAYQSAPGRLAAKAANAVRGQTPLYDPQQLPAQRGQVQQFTLTPRGDIDGLILTDGTEVKTPPHLSTQIAYAIKPGDTITIHGLHAAALPLVQAVSITDDATGRRPIPSRACCNGDRRSLRRDRSSSPRWARSWTRSRSVRHVSS